ncbi:hypothetical protein ACXY89_10110, partial [Escherichia coli]
WLMMSLWDALRMNMMISYQELVRTFHSGKRRFKRKQNIFCVDNSVFTWVLILWYEQKKKNTTRG